MKSKGALITGVTGFIGSNLARRLVKENWKVHAIVRETSSLILIEDIKDAITLHFYDGSIASLENIIQKSNAEVVFHLASLFLVQHQASDVARLIESNILFGAQLLEVMRISGVTKLINTGTAWQHYQNDEYNPVCLYAATKQAFEAIVEYYVQNEKFKIITLKLFDTYGPGDNRAKLFNLLWKVAVEQNVLDMSPGEQLLDLVYIDDVVSAFLMAEERIERFDSGLHEKCFVSSNKLIKLRDLITKYEAAIGTKLPIRWGGRPYRSREIMVPYKDGKLLPGWEPKVSLEEGLNLLKRDKDRTIE